jgi:hypothetical protein
MGPQTAPRVREPGTQYLWECIYRMAAIDANSAFQLHLTADTRHPLFHRPLVEFMLSLDPSLRAWGRNDRILQRRALADRLPEAVRTRMTKGSDQQLREREQMKNETWQRMLTKDSRLVSRGWVDPRLWRAQVERARFGVFNGLGCFDAAIMTECWLRPIEAHPFGPAPELR